MKNKHWRAFSDAFGAESAPVPGFPKIGAFVRLNPCHASDGRDQIFTNASLVLGTWVPAFVDTTGGVDVRR